MRGLEELEWLLGLEGLEGLEGQRDAVTIKEFHQAHNTSISQPFLLIEMFLL